MKVIPIGLATRSTLVFGIRIVRKDGTVLGWTQGRDATVTVDGVPTALFSNPGFDLRSLVSTSGLSVDNTEAQVIAGADLTRADILAKKWDGARVYLFRYDWTDPAAGIIPIKRGSFGNFTPRLGEFVVEFRDLRQALQPNSTWVLQEGCRWRLGDARCGKNLAAFTFNATVTAVASNYTFTASALTQAADYFGEGELTWTAGLNNGLSFKVKAFAAGVVTLAEFAVYDIDIGDTFTIVAGCRKRHEEDCVGKFDNGLNYGGEKDKPTRDDLIRPATPAQA